MNAQTADIFSQHRGRAFLWLDYRDYAARLLAGGNAPWGDPTALVAWFRAAQGLLHSDVVMLPAAAVAAAHAAPADADGDPLRRLRQQLSDATLRQAVNTTLAGLRAAFPALPLVLHLPTPGAWLALLLRDGADASLAQDEDSIDAAAVLIADFLRSFANAGLDGLLLDELDGTPPQDADALYLPLLNVASHYGWRAGWRCGEGACAGFAFVLAPDGDIAECAWPASPSTAMPAHRPAHRPRYLRIPVDGIPEQVLSVLEAQR